MKTGLILAAALVVLAPFALGEGPVSAPQEAASAETVVADIMKALRKNEGTVRVGMVVTKADRATPGAAKHIDQRYLPLAGSWLDPDGRLQGTLDWDTDLDTGKRVDSIRVVTITGPFDRKAMGKTVAAAGKKLGLDLEPDEEDPDTYFDYRAKDIELWITIGDGIVVVEAEAAD